MYERNTVDASDLDWRASSSSSDRSAMKLTLNSSERCARTVAMNSRSHTSAHALKLLRNGRNYNINFKKKYYM